jgi:hypothetical protein
MGQPAAAAAILHRVGSSGERLSTEHYVVPTSQTVTANAYELSQATSDVLTPSGGAADEFIASPHYLVPATFATEVPLRRLSMLSCMASLTELAPSSR